MRVASDAVVAWKARNFISKKMNINVYISTNNVDSDPKSNSSWSIIKAEFDVSQKRFLLEIDATAIRLKDSGDRTRAAVPFVWQYIAVCVQ